MCQRLAWTRMVAMVCIRLNAVTASHRSFLELMGGSVEGHLALARSQHRQDEDL